MAYRFISIRYLLPICCFIIPLLASSPTYAAEKMPYLSQNFIDSSIQFAYYKFLEASSVRLSQDKQLQAIKYARSVCTKLRKMAENDPNRSYVYWRVGELENQIMLEEEEITLKQQIGKQKEINKLVAMYNAEIGKWRPSFSALRLIEEQMGAVSSRKADEIEGLSEKRNRNISREVCYFLNKAFESEDTVTIAKEYEYLQKNRKYLLIKDTVFDTFNKKLHAKEEIKDLIGNIDTRISEIQAILGKNGIGTALHAVQFMKGRLSDIRAYVSNERTSEFSRKVGTLSASIAKIEDSLVNVNLLLIKSGKIDEAVDYCSRILIAYGVSPTKINLVDKELQKYPTVVNDRKSQASANKEIASFEDIQSRRTRFDFDNAMDLAKMKADSLAEVHGTNGGNRNSSDPMLANSTSPRSSGNTQTNSSNHRSMADAEEIYRLLENNKPEEAYHYFISIKKLLKKNLNSEAYSVLENTVLSSYKK